MIEGSTMKNRKLKSSNYIIIAAIIISGILLIRLSIEVFVPERNIVMKKLEKAAEELNKVAPFMINEDTRLESAAAVPENSFHYNYTLVNYTIDEIDVDALEKRLALELLENIKSNELMKSFREERVTIAYNYSDKNGIFLFALEFTPPDYLPANTSG